MNASRNWRRARTDAAAAADALTDAASFAGSGLATRAAEGLDDAREALARAIEPPQAKARRLPWLLAVLGLTALSAWGWRSVLAARRAPVDPGTPVPTVAPSEDQIFGKHVGNGQSRTGA